MVTPCRVGTQPHQHHTRSITSQAAQSCSSHGSGITPVLLKSHIYPQRPANDRQGPSSAGIRDDKTLPVPANHLGCSKDDVRARSRRDGWQELHSGKGIFSLDLGFWGGFTPCICLRSMKGCEANSSSCRSSETVGSGIMGWMLVE